jgi:hypothetical protein
MATGFAEEKKIEPPKVLLAFPFGLISGRTNNVEVRGIALTNATALRLEGKDPSWTITLKTNGAAQLACGLEAAKFGDTRLEVAIFVPTNAATGKVSFVVATAQGETPPRDLLVVDIATFAEEKEPNGGFRQAQEIRLPETIQGSIHEAKDVDVFIIHGKAGQKIRAEVAAQSWGSALDGLLSLYDSSGRLLASADDHGSSKDPILEFLFPADGDYYLSLIDALDAGGPLYFYQLSVDSPK